MKLKRCYLIHMFVVSFLLFFYILYILFLLLIKIEREANEKTIADTVY